MKYKIVSYCICLFFLGSWLLSANPNVNDSNRYMKYSNSSKLLLKEEPVVSMSSNNEVSISFTLENTQSTSKSISEVFIKVENVTNDKSVPTTNSTIANFVVAANTTHEIAGLQIFTSEKYNLLDSGAHVISFQYKLNNVVYTLPLSFFYKLGSNQIDTYQINKHNYQGLPVYALKGGMSAEYTVQKSLATLNGGISHTWEVRSGAGGGPVSVYSSSDFLKKSLDKTVELYNNELGATTNFNTVIISTGVPAASYLSYYMGAPVLPLHFLAAVNSFAEVETMVHSAIKDGYSCYSTAGYDPSMPGEGVAWIKLLDLPNQYKQFIIDHNVQNVVIMGATESGFGETGAKRLEFKFPVSNPKTYEEGSVYVMTHGGDVGLQNLKSYFKDYNLQVMDPQISIADWESGITKSQIDNFKAAIDNIPSTAVYVIEGSDTVGFYNITADLALKFDKKNATTFGSSPPSSIIMNEYMIGYPAYESRVRQIPFFYWQGDNFENSLATRVKNLLDYKVTTAYPNVNFKALPVRFNSQANRTVFIDAVKNTAGMTDVKQNSWQKADVWNPSNGLEAPCEIAAKDIVNNLGGATQFKNFISGLTKLTIDDLKNMAVKETSNTSNHPEPTITANVAAIPDAGLDIKRYEFPAQAYWNSREQLKEIELYDYTTTTATSLGWVDGYSKTGNERKQRIIISQFNLGNTSDEYDLKIGYKFNPKTEDGFPSYDASKGDEQNMDCFEYTRVPKTSWLDIPSRVMAREGAVWIVNGSVYDWDYNGLPGVVPYIKKQGVVKAQPQILSYKGEGAFAWNWGAQKSAAVLSRPKEIAKNTLSNDLKTLFHSQTSGYTNVLAGMTFMSGGNAYDIKALQPQWMLDYPEFNPKYLGPSGTAIRCFLSNPDPEACPGALERAWGSIEFAPDEEGWNDCSKLSDNTFVQRFSTLAYRQYDKLFEQVPNARTYVAIKGNKLDIGIIDGDLGNFTDARGVNYSKTFGMKNSEVSKFYQYKGYDKLINLDGGSSSQIWYNARGPLHDWTGYPLDADNQGPFYSRLVSSYLMLIPKKHTEEISAYKNDNNQYLLLDNSELTFNYDDNADHGLDKAFVSLSPSKDLLTDANGMIAGNFMVENPEVAQGAILFYKGEDTYYEDTEGLRTVVPTMRNILVVGIGKIPNYMLNTFKNKPLLAGIGNNEELQKLLAENNQSFYLLKMQNGNIVQYKFEDDTPFTKYLDKSWHSFMVYNGKNPNNTNQWLFSVKVDDKELNGKGTSTTSQTPFFGSMFDMGVSTHAAIGMANIDGRFVTGNAKLAVDNYLFVNGGTALQSLQGDLNTISSTLTSERKLPNLINKYYGLNTYALQFEEALGKHSFSLAETANSIRLYGLNLNVERVQNTLSGLTETSLASGNYYMIDDEDKCMVQDRNAALKWQAYKDGQGTPKWSLCSQVEVTDESIQGDTTTQYNRSFKIKGKSSYIAIDPLHFQVTTLPGSTNSKVSNHNLYALQAKAIMKPYQVGATPADGTPLSVALTENGLGSFPYEFVEASTTSSSSTNSSSSSAVSSSLTPGQIVGITVGSVVVTGLTGVLIKRGLSNGTSGYRALSSENEEHLEMDMLKKCN